MKVHTYVHMMSKFASFFSLGEREREEMSSSMQVTIPSHIGPGGTFDIRTLNGNIVMVTCPPDKVGGMNMIVTLDEKGLFVASNATQVQPVQVQPVLVQQQPVVVHAQPFQLQPGTVAVVHDQVMVREQQSILLHELSIHPHHGVCPNCKQDVVTICEQQRCTGDQCGVCMASVGALACFCWYV